MAVDFKTSQTKDNLMRAFAGESQPETVIPLQHHRQRRSTIMLSRLYSDPANQRRSMPRSSMSILKS